MSTITIERNVASTVYINTTETGWALFIINPIGDLVLTSDWGTYSNRWRGFGENFEEFLKGLDPDYFVGKMSRPDVNQYPTSTKQLEILKLLFTHLVFALKNEAIVESKK
jgi:hypothetical protein